MDALDLFHPVLTPPMDRESDALAERIAMGLLQRYGVVFRYIAVPETSTLPWRDVLRALRRLEARGAVRGGRFVSGFVGEQYGLPEAVDALRRGRHQPRNGERVRVSAVDPANLTGIVLPGPRVPAQPDRWVEYVDGLPVDATAAPEPAQLAAS